MAFNPSMSGRGLSIKDVALTHSPDLSAAPAGSCQPTPGCFPYHLSFLSISPSATARAINCPSLTLTVNTQTLQPNIACGDHLHWLREVLKSPPGAKVLPQCPRISTSRREVWTRSLRPARHGPGHCVSPRGTDQVTVPRGPGTDWGRSFRLPPGQLPSIV